MENLESHENYALGRPLRCPLCLQSDVRLYFSEGTRAYWGCNACLLVFVPSRYHLSPEDARARYDKHRNRPGQPGYEGYRKFLTRLVNVVVPRLAVGADGLDFGCGPSPVMGNIMEQRGFTISNYDPLFVVDSAVLKRKYDFVLCSETVEHFTQPAEDWKLLVRSVKPGGLLAVMTQRLVEEKQFADWYYKRDATHVSFYAQTTMEWIAAQHGLEASLYPNGIAIFRF